MYAGKTLAEIALLTDVQLRFVFFRPRDKYGMLIRHGDKPRDEQDQSGGGSHPKESEGVRAIKIAKVVPYHIMLKQVWTNRGMTPEQIEVKWKEWLAEHPSYNRRGRG